MRHQRKKPKGVAGQPLNFDALPRARGHDFDEPRQAPHDLQFVAAFKQSPFISGESQFQSCESPIPVALSPAPSSGESQFQSCERIVKQSKIARLSRRSDQRVERAGARQIATFVFPFAGEQTAPRFEKQRAP